MDFAAAALPQPQPGAWPATADCVRCIAPLGVTPAATPPPYTVRRPLHPITRPQDCWAQDPRKRPAMEEVVSRLEDIQGLDFLTQETGSDCACCVVS